MISTISQMGTSDMNREFHRPWPMSMAGGEAIMEGGTADVPEPLVFLALVPEVLLTTPFANREIPPGMGVHSVLVAKI